MHDFIMYRLIGMLSYIIKIGVSPRLGIFSMRRKIFQESPRGTYSCKYIV